MRSIHEHYFVRDPSVCDGQPVVQGTRIPVQAIYSALARGATPREILGTYPKLSEDALNALISYAAEVVGTLPLPRPIHSFEIFDLAAWPSFESMDSFGFTLKKTENDATYIIGSLAVHYPCKGHVKARVRMDVNPFRPTIAFDVLKVPGQKGEDILANIRKIFVAMAIPQDVIYEAHFVLDGGSQVFTNRTDTINTYLPRQ